MNAGLIIAIIYAFGAVATYVFGLVLTATKNNKNKCHDTSSSFLQEIAQAVTYSMFWPITLPALFMKFLDK